jgi:hypothetical protein
LPLVSDSSSYADVSVVVPASSRDGPDISGALS